MIKGTPNAGINGTLANGLLAHYSFNDGSLSDLSGNGSTLEPKLEKQLKQDNKLGLHLKQKLFMIESQFNIAK